jgi:S-DNA-T family DNA segregation ATPase FtsK/SpoIIIE
LDSSKFLPIHKGVGILRGAGDDTDLGDAEAVTVRTHRLDLRSCRAIADRGRQLRVGSGTLTGTAAGEEVLPEAPQRRLLDDILDIFEPSEDRMWSETICHRLAARWPDAYDGWDPTTLANVLNKFSIETTQQWGRTADGRGANRRGITRQALLDAIAAREDRTIDARTVGETGIQASGERSELPASGLRAGRPALAGQPASPSTPDTDPEQAPSG